MHIGFGLYRHQLDDAHFAFARQCGATHLIVHLCDYFRQSEDMSRSNQPVGQNGWGVAEGRLWSVDELLALKERMGRHGLSFYAVENFDPGLWSDVLLGGPRRDEQLAQVAQQIRNVGAAGIPVFGYNFSLAGVAGRITTNNARGGAESVGMAGITEQVSAPMSKSMVWNMVIDATAQGLHEKTTPEELWRRCAHFLRTIVPVAEAAGVRLAAHPDDPPLPEVRGQPRLIYQPRYFQRLLDIVDSPSNSLDLCLGTVAEMTEGSVLETVESCARQQRIAYLHVRNVRGKVPYYEETFIDEGETDMYRVIEILHRNGFDGVLIPDHSPQMSCDAPWHAGMAFTMGYINALVQRVRARAG